MSLFEEIRASKLVTGVNPLPDFGTDPIITHDWNGSANSSISHYYELKRALSVEQELKIIFVLPVQSLDQTSFGNGIDEVKELLDSNEIEDNVLFIQPRFLVTPWYANHPSNVNIQQEDSTVELINIILAKYSMFPNKKVYLLGYSKSGYGAVNIQLRYPSIVDGIFIWDAPVALDTFITSDMASVFDNVTYLQENYNMVDLLSTNSTSLEGKEIVVGGYKLWETLSKGFTDELTSNYPSVNFTLNETMDYNHTWNKEWVKELLQYSS
jgi:hypothetical protein